VISPTVIDLFCGAGGLALGFSRAGFEHLCAVDCVKPAVETYRQNLGRHVRLETISHEIELPPTDVIVGGPPCQGFSSAGLRRENDSRNSLVGVFANIIARMRPRAFVFENVEGFLTTGGGEGVFHLLRPLIAAGYRIHLRKINAANYGIPQHRKRVVAIGGLGWDPLFPEPTHSAFGAPGAHLTAAKLPPTPTLGDTISNLPVPSESEERASPKDHFTRPLSGDDLRRAELLKPGQRMRDLPQEFWHSSYHRRANRRVADGTPVERRGGAPAGVLRLKSDEPSKAITSAARTEFLHPIENRNLTLRECARLQTFPDDFEFRGSLPERAQLLGNAVPPMLGEVIARSLALSLSGSDGPKSSRGSLLSFIPTPSNGMSPALEATTHAVRMEFKLRDGGKQLALWH
jgi:DNA (cytosine-5)-methyltransferase 1